ncbi:hypothetical protein BH742_11660 [Enterococcus durans]|nr:hypothetical protein BH742_11660 [Enterococcus durans]
MLLLLSFKQKYTFHFEGCVFLVMRMMLGKARYLDPNFSATFQILESVFFCTFGYELFKPAIHFTFFASAIVVQIYHKWIDQQFLVYSHKFLLFLYRNG